MIKRIISSTLLLLTPLVFAPITLNFFYTNKHAFVVLMTLALLIATGLNHLFTKKHPHQSSFWVVSLGLFWIIMGLELLLTREARVESLINKGVLFLTLPIVSYLIATTKKTTKNMRWALIALISSGSVLALHGILQLVILSEISGLPAWMKSIVFSPAGSPLALTTTVIFTLIATAAWAIKEKNITTKTSLLVSAGIQLAALVAYGFMFAQGEIIISLLPLRASWSLALDAIKNVRELFLGIGLANFPVLFTQFKPVSLIPADFWTTVFQTATNEILQLLATTGILGLGSFIVLLVAAIKTSLKLEKTPLTMALKLTLYAVIISFFLIPATVITYTFFFVLAGLVAANSSHETKKEINLPSYTSFVTATIIGAAVFISGFFTYRVYAAEVLMRQAQIAYGQNDAERVYAAHVGAVQHMPQLTDYRISLSQINLTLASSISQNKTADEKLTDQQREQVSTLVQRAIEQGRVATNLRPNLYTTWQNLGGIYRNLINVVEGSEEFAIQYLGQAVTVDPANPISRVEYGGLFFQLSQLVEDQETQTSLLDQAVQQFQIAIKLKSNYANAYYNLANALDKKGAYRQAYQAMSQVLANIDPNSPDYQKAQQELLALEKKLPQTPQQEATQETNQQNTQSELQQPAQLPSPLPGGLIELPQETKTEEDQAETENSNSTTDPVEINNEKTTP